MVAEIFGMDGVIVVVMLAVVLFGGSQIPKLARSLGSARREFTEGLRSGDSDSDSAAAAVVTPVIVPVASAPVSVGGAAAGPHA
jgi:sec-independent protein translocase protein TatA